MLLEDHQVLLYQEDLEVLDGLWNLWGPPHLKDYTYSVLSIKEEAEETSQTRLDLDLDLTRQNIMLSLKSTHKIHYMV